MYRIGKFFKWFFDLFAERYNGYILKYSRCNSRRRKRERDKRREEKFRDRLRRKGLQMARIKRLR